MTAAGRLYGYAGDIYELHHDARLRGLRARGWLRMSGDEGLRNLDNRSATHGR